MDSNTHIIIIEDLDRTIAAFYRELCAYIPLEEPPRGSLEAAFNDRVIELQGCLEKIRISELPELPREMNCIYRKGRTRNSPIGRGRGPPGGEPFSIKMKHSQVTDTPGTLARPGYLNNMKMDLKKENIITDWNDTIGLKIVEVKEVVDPKYDDPIELTLIIFDNGKFVIQRDQSYHTTTCGLISNGKDHWLKYFQQ